MLCVGLHYLQKCVLNIPCEPIYTYFKVYVSPSIERQMKPVRAHFSHLGFISLNKTFIGWNLRVSIRKGTPH